MNKNKSNQTKAKQQKKNHSTTEIIHMHGWILNPIRYEAFSQNRDLNIIMWNAFGFFFFMNIKISADVGKVGLSRIETQTTQQKSKMYSYIRRMAKPLLSKPRIMWWILLHIYISLFYYKMSEVEKAAKRNYKIHISCAQRYEHWETNNQLDGPVEQRV